MKTFQKYIVLFLMAILLVSSVAAQPTLTITSPTDGTVTTEHYIRVEGTSSGTLGEFNHTSEADFDQGTPDNITVDPSGQIELGGSGLGLPIRQNNGNPVMVGDGTGFDSSFASAGVVVNEDSTYKMWYIGNDGSKSQTGYATSTDGLSWSRLDNPVIPTSTGWEATRASTGGLINDSGTFRAMYTGHDGTWNDRIGYATSPDGSTAFTKQNGGNPVMGPGTNGKFDDFGVFSGSLIKEGTTYKMYYMGSDGVHFRIGLAHSSDCISWTRQNSGNAVLDLGSSGSFDDWDVGGSFVFKYDGKYYLFYSADSDSSHSDWKIGYAISDDGVSFTRANGGQPWLTIGQNGKFDDKYVSGPRGVIIGGTLHLWYSGRSISGNGGTGYVKATFGGNSGIFTSPPLDAGGPVVWGSIDYTADQPSGTTLVVKTRSSDDGLSWSTWQAVVDGGDIQSPDNRFIQYQVIMTRSGQNTPALQDISIGYVNPVSKVEVSLDQATWFPVDGTVDNWYLDIEVQEGSNTIYVKATDISGHPTIKSVDVVADFTPPTGSIELNDGAVFTLSPTVTASLSAGDLSGIDSMLLSEDQTFTDGTWEPYLMETDWDFSETDGNKTLYVKFLDNSGLESEVYSDTIMLDTTPPTGTMTVNDGAEYTNAKSVTIKINASDENGINGVILSKDQIFAGSFEEMQDSFTFDLEGADGQKYVWARVKDTAGHTVDLADDIILDTTPPTLTVTVAGGDTLTGNPIVSLSMDASDEHGVQEMMVSNEPSFIGALWEPFQQAMVYDLGITDGLKTIYVKVRDPAGNEATGLDTITLNTVPPAGILKINDGDIYTTSTSVILAIAVDNETEIQSMMVSNDISFVGASWQSFSNTVQWTLDPGDGIKTVYLKLMNIFGISNSNISASITLDTTAPKVGITEPAKSKVAKKTLTLVGTASDENGLSKVEVKVGEGNWTLATGLENWTYVIDNLPVGKHSVIVKATDKAGNEQVTAKEITRKKTSQNTPGFELIGLFVTLTIGAVLVNRRP